ncbi:MAG: DUF92 domain-containing protein [Chloroflexota bacterium]
MSQLWVRHLLWGLGLGTVVGLTGQRTGYLSAGGMAALILMSILVFVAGGWVWGAVLLAYVLSTNLWARYRASDKAALAERFREGATRHTDQVVARLGWATIVAFLGAYVAPNAVLYGAYVGALAASAADDWATELGVLSASFTPRASPRRWPLLLISGRPVAPGTPGAVSGLGLGVSALGAWFIGLVGLLAATCGAWSQRLALDPCLRYLPVAAMLGGLAGSLTDSLLGATAQGVYYCEHCQQLTERPAHACGERAQQVRGWAWLNNEVVNLVGALVGAGMTAGVIYLACALMA